MRYGIPSIGKPSSVISFLPKLLLFLTFVHNAQVGTKLRFSCAKMSAPHGPCDPLQDPPPAAASTPMLQLTYNAGAPGV